MNRAVRGEDRSHARLMKMTINKGIIAAVLSTGCSSVATVCLAGAARAMPPLVVSGLGAVVGALILLILSKMWLRGETRLRVPNHLWPTVLLVAVLRGAAGGALLVYGLSLTTAAKAVFLTKIEPYIVLLFGWFSARESVERRELILLAVHIFGAVLLSVPLTSIGPSSVQSGDALIVLAMCFMAATYSPGQRMARQLGGTLSAALTSGIGGLLLLSLALSLRGAGSLHQSTEAWAYFASYLLLFHVLALSLWFTALDSLKGWLVSALRALGPLLGAPAAWLLLDETLSAQQWIGGGIVVWTSFLLSRARASPKGLNS